MKKLHVLGVALCAVFAFCAVAVSSASALSQWLLNGGIISTAVPATSTTGVNNLLLEDTGAGADVLCSGSFDGTVGPGAADLITEVLDLENKLVGAAGLHCEEDSGLCLEKLATVLPLNLPWATEIMLTAGGVFFNLILEDPVTKPGLPGYEVECKTIVGTIKDVCSGESGAEIKNITGGVEGAFLEANEEITPAGSCTVGGAKSGLLSGVGTETSTSGTISVSDV
jgi:hypothetical protein